MGLLQNARQRLGSAANFVARPYHSDAANAIRFQNESRRYIDEHGARLMEEYRRDRALGRAGAVSDDEDEPEEYSPRHH